MSKRLDQITLMLATEHKPEGLGVWSRGNIWTYEQRVRPKARLLARPAGWVFSIRSAKCKSNK